MTDDDRDTIEPYAGGEVGTRRGRINAWLLVVYVALTIWAVVYLMVYWGGLGPGLGD
jgi:hypothetical protein